jgi:hypothetical protein
MHPNAALIDRFYKAFAAKDSATMAACYHDRVRFSDPVFPNLEGERARGMWKMLVARGKDLRVEHSGVEADDISGKAHWDAYYSFGPQQRKVHNSIDARFKFQDGLIIEHVDSFDLWKWTRMALGVPGVLLGWSPMIQGKVRKQAGSGLDQWMRGS